MADHAPKKSTPRPPAFVGWMAEFADEDALLAAARKIRDAGYTRTDAFTPFPVHGIDDALGIRPTVLPWITLVCGATGTVTALTMQIWMNAIDYPYIISGKPFISLPAFIPVAFELTILFSAFSTVIGMLALNRLFRFSRPMFSNPRFDRATDDRFFLYVDAKDKYFNKDSVRELLASSSPDVLDELHEDNTPSQIPRAVWLGLVLLLAAALIPMAMVLNIRASRTTEPRWHVFFDMDFQPYKQAQEDTAIFADGRAMRPQVIGTVARGQLERVDPYYLGYDPAQLTSATAAGGTRLVAFQEEGETPADGPAAAEQPDGQSPAVEEAAEDETTADAAAADSPPATPNAGGDAAQPGRAATAEAADADKPANVQNADQRMKPAEPQAVQPEVDQVGTTNESTRSITDATAAQPAGGAASTTAGSGAPAQPPKGDDRPQLPFISELPLEATPELMAIGQQQFEIYCTACHGYAGDGNGLAASRAAALAQGYWLAPTSLHDPAVRAQPVGQIYYTITHGKGKMGSYGTLIDPRERWAIVLYIRALQRARDAKIEDVPKDQRGSIAAPATN